MGPTRCLHSGEMLELHHSVLCLLWIRTGYTAPSSGTLGWGTVSQKVELGCHVSNGAFWDFLVAGLKTGSSLVAGQVDMDPHESMQYTNGYPTNTPTNRLSNFRHTA